MTAERPGPSCRRWPRVAPRRRLFVHSAGIRRLAAAHGHEALYHETLTRFWVRIVAHMVGARPDIAAFDVFIAAFPQALDTRLPHRHWRHDTIQSAAARAALVKPDLLALPG